MKDTNSVESCYTLVIGLINKMETHGEAIYNRRVVEKVLRSLPPKFESLLVTLEENKHLNNFTIDELQAFPIIHDHRINRSNTLL